MPITAISAYFAARTVAASATPVNFSWGIIYGRARRVLLRLPVPWCAWPALVGGEGLITLGIDEHRFRGTDVVITLTCLRTHRPVAILPNGRQATLRRC